MNTDTEARCAAISTVYAMLMLLALALYLMGVI